MKKFLAVILTLLFPLLASAQQFEGDWNGKLSVGVQKLTLVFHIHGNTCTLDSPDQGVKGILAQLKSMKCPAFLLNGDKDLQVPVGVNFGSLPPFKHKKSQYKVYPALNHLFQHCTTGTVAEYGEIEETISPEVLEDIAAFIQNIR